MSVKGQGNLKQKTIKQITKQSIKDSSSQYSQSCQSILSDDFLGKQALQQIKASTVKAQEKCITKWTSVVLGSLFPRVVQPSKLQYNSGQLLNSGEIPKHVQTMEGGVIIKLPLEQIEDYLQKNIDVCYMRSDDTLCEFLETFLTEIRNVKLMKNKNSISCGRDSRLLQDEVEFKLQQESDINSSTKLANVLYQSINSKHKAQQQQENPFLKRREAKLACKKLDVISLYSNDKLKPKQIAKKLRLGIDVVYKTIEKFKYEVKNKVLDPKPMQKVGRKGVKDNEVLLELIQKYFTLKGIYEVTGQKLHQYLIDQQKNDPKYKTLKVPCVSTLHKILREKFHLRYGKTQAANARYRDPNFNEKRLWVSRLLAQFMLEDAVIISVDESNFRSDCMPSKQWSFNQKDMYKPKCNKHQNLPNQNLDTQILCSDNKIMYGELLLNKAPLINEPFAFQTQQSLVDDGANQVDSLRDIYSKIESSQVSQSIEKSESNNNQNTLKSQQKLTKSISAKVSATQTPQRSIQGITSVLGKRQIQSQTLSQDSSGKSSVDQNKSNVTSKAAPQLSQIQTPSRKDKFNLKKELSPIPEFVESVGNQASITKYFQKMKLESSAKSIVSEDLSARKLKSGLTPILDKIHKLQLNSSRKKSTDFVKESALTNRFNVTPKKLYHSSVSSHRAEKPEDYSSSYGKNVTSLKPQPETQDQENESPLQQRLYIPISAYQNEMKVNLGKYGMKIRDLSIQKSGVKRQQYSMSFIAAISQERVISSQIIEGAFDSVLFENFIYYTLRSVRTDKDLHAKKVVLLMDNAIIHKYSEMLETARKFKVHVLFNAEYSPWLNPIEQLFSHIKKNLKVNNINSKMELVQNVSQIIQELTAEDIKGMWAFSIKKWIHTLRYGFV